MQTTYHYPSYPYRRAAELDDPQQRRVPVLIVGAGPVGLSAAIDLAMRDIPVVLVDDEDTVSNGSRAVCYAKRTLEVLDRLGVGERITSKGVSWNVGRTFLGDQEVYNFNLLPEPGHHRPGMVNLQQYYLEEELVRRIAQLPLVDLRWKNRVVALEQDVDGVLAQIETPDGSYSLKADWMLAADGARSPIRQMCGLDVTGKVFQDRFLIADIVMKADFPAERRFWFDPPFHPGLSVLLHKQSHNVWRIDWQLGWDADPEEEKKPERVLPRIRAMLGEQVQFELEWLSVYTFQCRRMAAFMHRRVLFVGDSAHQVSPFGARGANSGIQDVDNLGWKLALVLQGRAPASLLESYCDEREPAADENIMNSTRSTDFITPKSPVSRMFRNATLTLARDFAFARSMVNSGRLSVPSYYRNSPLNTPDVDGFAGRMIPGAPMDDAPVLIDGQPGWLLEQLAAGFNLLLFVSDPAGLKGQLTEELRGLASGPIPVGLLLVCPKKPLSQGRLPGRLLIDADGLVARRYDAREMTAYLVRPDQYVSARFRKFHLNSVRGALDRASGQALQPGRGGGPS